jgi:hypothetical protein
MMGMEKMLAGMMGMTPEQMREQFNGFTGAASEAVDLLRAIRTDQTKILERLTELENGNGK